MTSFAFKSLPVLNLKKILSLFKSFNKKGALSKISYRFFSKLATSKALVA